jgi:ketosteroid isomerase-like protein
VAGYYAALDGFDLEATLSFFTDEAVYAVPPAGGIETDERNVARGKDALRHLLSERGPKPYHHEIRICGLEDRDCIVEGVTVDPAAPGTAMTFVASIQFADDGRIARYLAFSCTPPIEAWAGDAGLGVTADAAALTDRYFHHLDTGDFDVAADCFSTDTLYSHPPYRHTGITKPGRVEFRGRPALRAAFGQRGKQSFGHRLVAQMQRGRHYLFEGVVEGLPNDSFGSFISVLTLDDDGRAARYLSFFCEPGVRRQ